MHYFPIAYELLLTLTHTLRVVQNSPQISRSSASIWARHQVSRPICSQDIVWNVKLGYFSACAAGSWPYFFENTRRHTCGSSASFWAWNQGLLVIGYRLYHGPNIESICLPVPERAHIRPGVNQTTSIENTKRHIYRVRASIRGQNWVFMPIRSRVMEKKSNLIHSESIIIIRRSNRMVFKICPQKYNTAGQLWLLRHNHIVAA